MIRTLAGLVVFWLGGLLTGHYTAALECREARPATVRYSYVDTTPPPCVFQPTRDLRHVCEWERARKQ